MNKKFLISWVAVFVAWMAGSFLVHGYLLYDGYAALPNLFRPEAETQDYMYIMLLAHVLMAGAFVWIYNRGSEAKPWLAQGFRFGCAIAILAPIPTYMIYYVVQPVDGNLVVKQIIFDSALVVLLGILTAFLNKPAAAGSV